ncbi:heat shock protein Hsp70: cytosolic-like protein [Leptotrombidium deliense]|uniref:Heat shock protein Hsp70: cytosolic-like protein n=1 Tax=Leptotrombidium deliense TaxID=299467 RepID=A0A443S477_9ACAR|nr:heat shock protein Hsp70: cytosolic-like protein [Leptotrombidium deliense]
MSYGVQLMGGLFNAIIPHNHPSKTQYGFSTVKDRQTAALIKIYQGERTLCKDNHYLGEFVVKGLPAKYCEQVTLHVTMSIDLNGILHVSATEDTTGVSKSIEIENENRVLTEYQKNDFIEKAAKMKLEDEAIAETIEARNKLQLFAFDLRRRMTMKNRNLWIVKNIVMKRE